MTAAHFRENSPKKSRMRRACLLLLSAASTRELTVAPHAARLAVPAALPRPPAQRARRVTLLDGEKPRKEKKRAFGAALDADIVGKEVLGAKADAEQHEALLRQGVREIQAPHAAPLRAHRARAMTPRRVRRRASTPRRSPRSRRPSRRCRAA